MDKKKIIQESKAFLAVVFFTFIYGASITWFLEAATEPLYTGGIPGIAQLLRDVVNKYTDLNFGNLFLGLFVFIGNIPIMILGWFGVSKRFTLYSLVSVVIQATVLGLTPRVDFGISDTFTLAVLGGLLGGIGVGGALRFGTSTGGFDILAQFISLKRGVSVGYISMILNVLIALIGSFVYGSLAIAAYTIIRILVSTLATDKIHTSYNFLKLEIITKHPNEVNEYIMKEIHRGVTLIPSKGAYSKSEQTILMVVIVTFELTPIKDKLKEIDPNAFIIVEPVRHVYGNFARKTIV